MHISVSKPLISNVTCLIEKNTDYQMPIKLQLNVILGLVNNLEGVQI